MNRQQRRRVYKFTQQEVKDIEIKGIQKGIQFTLNVVYETLNEVFGFGDKRLNRLEERVLEKIREMGEEQ